MPEKIHTGGRPVESLIGRCFGRWTVTALGESAPGGRKWVCLCDPKRGGCGHISQVLGATLRGGGSHGCRSCASREVQSRDAVKVAARERMAARSHSLQAASRAAAEVNNKISRRPRRCRSCGSNLPRQRYGRLLLCARCRADGYTAPEC